ncbi:hypothetical protein GRI75_05560 [Altererythrobacter soli]|uniref:Uncharacterized protein n=1 Tax=Croceibacterium soli TaxID=1739690 RepID=A0A6I4UQJ7_9SPHN|nr:hypothetical protein [Croceibacterium soli]MXP41112.1 hypothetical protein [Croceibacterium soli]
MRIAGPASVLLAPILLAGAAASASAQDRARLDDFALPAGDGALAVEQLPAAAPLPPPQRRDRSVKVPAPPGAAPHPLEQLTSADRAEVAPNQLASGVASRSLAPAAVSTSADSKLQGVQRIGGRDRCDPRLDEQRRADCLRILELRAAEFQATEAPQLSAEQKLLAEQQREEERVAPSNKLRLRLASSGDPDADLSSNQEIAAIYLAGEDAAASPPPELPTEPGIPTGELIEALQAVQQGMSQP